MAYDNKFVTYSLEVKESNAKSLTKTSFIDWQCLIVFFSNILRPVYYLYIFRIFTVVWTTVWVLPSDPKNVE